MLTTTCGDKNMQIKMKHIVDVSIKPLDNASYQLVLSNFLGAKKTNSVHDSRLSQATLDFYRQNTLESAHIVGFGAFVGAQMIGFGAAVTDEDGVASHMAIAVLPDFRKNGIGTELADKLSRVADPPKSFNISAENTGAIRIAINTGLKPTGAKTITNGKGVEVPVLVFDSEDFE